MSDSVIEAEAPKSASGENANPGAETPDVEQPAAETEDVGDGDGQASETQPTAKWRCLVGKVRDKKVQRALIAAAAVAVVLSGFGGFFYWKWASQQAGKEVTVDLDVIVLHEMPEIMADLTGAPGRKAYLRLSILVEIAQQHLPELIAHQDSVISSLQLHLRDYRRDDRSPLKVRFMTSSWKM